MADIYREDAWPYLLDKYPRLNDLCNILDIKCALDAREFRNNYRHNITNALARELYILLESINFAECFFHEELVERMVESYNVGEYGDTYIDMGLLYSDLVSTYEDFLRLCDKRQVDLNNTSYNELLKIFNECLILKEGCQEPYIKYFNRRLAEDGYITDIPEINGISRTRTIQDKTSV